MSLKRVLGLVDYGRGNLRSVQRAIEHAGVDCIQVCKSADALGCDALVVPGVGSFGDCARQLREAGLWDFLKEWIQAGRHYLGICLGYQLLFESSEESPGVEGLGVLRGKVVHFPKHAGLKIPHMGWNQLHITTPSDRLMTGLGQSPDFYFVHSYYPERGAVSSREESGPRSSHASEFHRIPPFQLLILTPHVVVSRH